MKKLIVAILATLLLASPALATELNSDTGFANPSAWMLDPAASNPWTIASGGANGNGAKTMKMIMGMNSAIKRGHTYKWTLTDTAHTQGVIEVVIGPTMTGGTSGSWVGLRSSIADNFTTSSALTSGPAGSPGTGPDGAFRIFCSPGAIDNTDPVVYPGLYGRSHTHTSWGNTNSLDPRGTISFWRANGGTTCGNVNSQRTPADRAAYWMPSFVDGFGHVIKPVLINQYYKGDSPTHAVCTNPADPGYAPGAGGACVNVPIGIQFIAGYDFSTGFGGPADNSDMFWTCQGAGTYLNPVSHDQRTQHLSDLMHGGCALRGQGGNAAGVGGVISIAFTMQTCWDGAHTDSPNHRDHVSRATRTTPYLIGGCPDSHPYHFPAPNPLIYWNIDQHFYDGYWHLSSDEMVAGKVSGDPGGTMHMDFSNAWSPAVLSTWYTNCITPMKSCGGGALGDGTVIKDGAIITPTNGGPPVSPSHLGDPAATYFDQSKIGIGTPIRTSGTYSGEIVADADGHFGITAYEDLSGNGYNGKVTFLSITEITSGHKGPVTITH